MKIVAVLVLLFVASPVAFSAETTVAPKPSADMWDLDHYRYYTWGIDLGFKTEDAPITEAVLTFQDIRNWNTSENVLYLHLLDGAPLGGLDAGRDSKLGGDYFAGKGVLIDAWKDDTATPRDLSYRFSEITVDNRSLLDVLNEYGADGIIGFGFDPDCHYYNNGITFTVTTAVVPAPGAVVLAGIGTALIGWLRRRRSL